MMPAKCESWVNDSDQGVAAILVAIMVPVFMLCCAFAIDISLWYVEGARAQKAADAAALAGVPYMPNNLNLTTPSATSTALDFASRNGYTNGVGSAAVTVEPVAGRSSQLKVTVRKTIPTVFASFIGIDTHTVVRSGTADYNGPAPMGSPCNALGNEPTAGVGPNAVGGPSWAPTGSVQDLTNPGCEQVPDFWGTVEGPATGKVQGDRYMTRTCAGGSADGCSGGTNSEYLRGGYYYVLRVKPDNTGQANTGPITVQLYDPAWVFTGPRCESINTSGLQNNMNPYTTTDGLQRYDDSVNAFCTGDYDPGGSGTRPRMDTSFAVLKPTLSQNPSEAVVEKASCIKQFKGVSNPPGASQLLNPTAGSANYGLASVFHQWVTLCTIDNPVPGDYYIQVRSNVALGGSEVPNTGQMVYQGNADVVNESVESNTTGRGDNSFGIRAFPQVAAAKSRINVAGWARMPIFANLTNVDATFNLLRVPPAAAGKNLVFTFYDVADAGGSGTVKVLPPSDATGPISTINNAGSTVKCRGFGVVGGSSGTNLTGCAVGVTPGGNNGKVQTITVPIPTVYGCSEASQTGCWFKVNVRFPGVTVNDIETWSATIEGDPVRLVK